MVSDGSRHYIVLHNVPFCVVRCEGDSLLVVGSELMFSRLYTVLSHLDQGIVQNHATITFMCQRAVSDALLRSLSRSFFMDVVVLQDVLFDLTRVQQGVALGETADKLLKTDPVHFVLELTNHLAVRGVIHGVFERVVGEIEVVGMLVHDVVYVHSTDFV